MDTSGLCSERTPGGGADESHSKDFGIPEPTDSSGRSADAAARAGGEPGTLRVSKADGEPEERGWRVNPKRIYRLYTEDGLTVRTKIRKKLARRQHAKPASINEFRAHEVHAPLLIGPRRPGLAVRDR